MAVVAAAAVAASRKSTPATISLALEMNNSSLQRAELIRAFVAVAAEKLSAFEGRRRFLAEKS